MAAAAAAAAAATAVQHRRTHNLLLITRLLSCRDQISPFTLVLDSLHQSGWPLLQEMMARAKAAKVHIIFVSFETLRRPRDADAFLRCHDKTHDAVQRDVGALVRQDRKNLVVFDTLHPLLAQDAFNATSFLSTLTTPTTSILAVYHTSIPLTSKTTATTTAYAPSLLALLRYLATAIITVHALKHVVDRKRALDRSTAPPLLGLEEGLDGALVALGSNDARGSVLEMEHRRRSGRSVVEWFYVAHVHELASPGSGGGGGKSQVILLVDHPEYPRSAQYGNAAAGLAEGDGISGTSTFELGLSEEQRRERDKVILPYFDAQSDGGVGQGGRILYDLGVEDDFDEEEDEM